MRRTTPLVIMGMALAAAAPAGQAIVLRYRPKPGQVTEYHYEGTLRGRTEIGDAVGRSVSYTTGAIVSTITGVEDGSATWETRLSHGERYTWSPGYAEPLVEQLPVKKRTGVFDSLGKTLWDTSTDDDKPAGWSDALEFALSLTAALPKAEVEVGANWTRDEPLWFPPVESQWYLTVSFKRTLAAVERYRGHDCARIATTFSGTMAPTIRTLARHPSFFPTDIFDTKVIFSGRSVVWLNLADGVAVGDRITTNVVYDDPGNFKTTWTDSELYLLKE